jgi:DNA polymerase-3 subunit delta
MKIYPSQLDNLLKSIEKGQISAVLLYGPDKGLIRSICSKLIGKFSLSTTNVDYQDLTASSLRMILNNQNFFNQRELIKINHNGSGIDKDFKDIFKDSHLHFTVIIADELPTSSALRKFFEVEEKLASIACYLENEHNISKLIISKCHGAKKQLDDDALTFLKENLKSDQGSITSELDKLLTFASDIDRISLKDVTEVISIDNSASGDEMCIHFANKDLDRFLNEATKLQQQNINEVLMIRALMRYYINLYTVITKIDNGQRIDEAMKSLSPPIFFKFVDGFKQNVQNLSRSETIKGLSVFLKAEMKFKTSPGTFDFYYDLFYPVWKKS